MDQNTFDALPRKYGVCCLSVLKRFVFVDRSGFNTAAVALFARDVNRQCKSGRISFLATAGMCSDSAKPFISDLFMKGCNELKITEEQEKERLGRSHPISFTWWSKGIPFHKIYGKLNQVQATKFFPITHVVRMKLPCLSLSMRIRRSAGMNA